MESGISRTAKLPSDAAVSRNDIITVPCDQSGRTDSIQTLSPEDKGEILVHGDTITTHAAANASTTIINRMRPPMTDRSSRIVSPFIEHPRTRDVVYG
jgi:hypothetical protein